MCDVLSHCRTYLCRRYDRTACAYVRILECLNAFLCYETSAVETLVEYVLYLVVDSRVVRLNLVVGRDADCLAVGTECECVYCCALEERYEGFLHLLRLCLLLEHHYVVATTSEVDTLAQATYEEAAKHDEDYDAEHCERCLI